MGGGSSPTSTCRCRPRCRPANVAAWNVRAKHRPASGPREEPPPRRLRRIAEGAAPPIVGPQWLGRLVRLAKLQRFAERVVTEEAHKLTEIDIGHATVAADDDHVLVVVLDGCGTEV